MESISKARAAALGLAELGFPVVLVHGIENGVCTCKKAGDCPTPGKHPRLNEWQHHATTDSDQVAHYFDKWPVSNVGALLGEKLCDIEHDTDEGKASAEELLAGIETPSYESHRSIHRLFQPPPFKPETAVVGVRGLECRFGTGEKAAQSVFPPSTHGTGKQYRWLDGLSPWQVELAPFPDVLTELIGKPAATDGEAFVMSSAMPFAEHPGAPEGERRNSLCSLVGYHLATHGADSSLVPLALAWATRCKPPLFEEEVLAVVGDLASKHQAKPAEKAKRRLLSTPYHRIEAQAVEWLWPERIALGKLTLLVGDPGLGKTYLATDLASRVSNGAPLPDGSMPATGEVAILTAEDGAGDTLRPRLDAHGADVSKVHHIEGIEAESGEEFLSLREHLPCIEEWLDNHPECKLFVIDPISSFLGKCDSHNNAEVRTVLGPVSKLAERRGVAFLGITHLSKAQGASINRVSGSIAFVAAARAAWRLGADPDEPSRRLFLPVKNNLGTANGLAFRLIDGRLDWESGEVLVSADELDELDNETPREEAERWLRATLAAGAVPSAQVLKLARADGISERTLKRARKALGVTADKIGDKWHVCLPEQPLPEEESPGVYIVE